MVVKANGASLACQGARPGVRLPCEATRQCLSTSVYTEATEPSDTPVYPVVWQGETVRPLPIPIRRQDGRVTWQEVKGDIPWLMSRLT
jgi:hypothetical protein